MWVCDRCRTPNWEHAPECTECHQAWRGRSPGAPWLPAYEEQTPHGPGPCYLCGQQAQILGRYRNPGEAEPDRSFWLCSACLARMQATDPVRRGADRSRTEADKGYYYPEYLIMRGPGRCERCGRRARMYHFPFWTQTEIIIMRLCASCEVDFDRCHSIRAVCPHCGVERWFHPRTGRSTCTTCGARDPYLFDCIIAYREFRRANSLWRRLFGAANKG